MQNINQISKLIITLLHSYIMLKIPVEYMEKYLAHIVYEHIMFGQIEHYKCHFWPFSLF